jgi:hypothetical protein
LRSFLCAVHVIWTRNKFGRAIAYYQDPANKLNIVTLRILERFASKFGRLKAENLVDDRIVWKLERDRERGKRLLSW